MRLNATRLPRIATNCNLSQLNFNKMELNVCQTLPKMMPNYYEYTFGLLAAQKKPSNRIVTVFFAIVFTAFFLPPAALPAFTFAILFPSTAFFDFTLQSDVCRFCVSREAEWSYVFGAHEQTVIIELWTIDCTTQTVVHWYIRESTARAHVGPHEGGCREYGRGAASIDLRRYARSAHVYVFSNFESERILSN